VRRIDTDAPAGIKGKTVLPDRQQRNASELALLMKIRRLGRSATRLRIEQPPELSSSSEVSILAPQ